jgi:DNA-binding CsgD family transcriptional regulator
VPSPNAAAKNARRQSAPAKTPPLASSDGDALLATLSAREREVLALYLKLLNPKAVASRLGTRPQTVRNQLASIEHKLGVRSTEELISKLLSS